MSRSVIDQLRDGNPIPQTLPATSIEPILSRLEDPGFEPSPASRAAARRSAALGGALIVPPRLLKARVNRQLGVARYSGCRPASTRSRWAVMPTLRAGLCCCKLSRS